MDWWRKLSKNSLARFGALVLLVFYLAAFAADFVAPYSPTSVQPNGSLLPPTQVYWRSPGGRWLGPHVYPTTLGPTDVETGEREFSVDWSQPSPLRLFVKGEQYHFLELTLPLPPTFEPMTLFPGIPANRHLFGAVGPARFNLLGTDEQGRDQFSRLTFGGRISLCIGLVGIAIAFPLGLAIGGISGYFGGWLDTGIMRLTEVLMTIPSIYLLVSLAAVLPPGLSSAQRFLLIVLITSFVSWSGLARVIRNQVLSIKEREFVMAARAMGANPFYIIARHVLPQTATYTIVSATLAVPSFIVAESVLSLIGLGIQQPDASWGNMLSLATNASIVVLQPWLIWPPALLIILTVLAFNLLGDGLRDALDPRSLTR
ncbi:ABC-type dipeptide/oligopeptide/nickel transport system, permease component [Rubidibacter lacunae KORDI 51-2]|uniref:ABC-type dipeptide/oligopeptide/nickel transport system, permease component n=1 Tax=Rubidibacter lacunae KORDI 51-2 TaxID=582515 RepID=U5DJR0_9CHRO|nr:ABC transporter permease [Rubidibacter lacunae]ERN41931.1 ABC-type dipeptide/oligopeptide/nickel transport system, permease component [Rubidibacter lacunae KORDI 51-2]